MTTQMLVVAAVCFRDAVDRILTVRKRGTNAFMLPGGKLEPGEAPGSAALREVYEELGVEITKKTSRCSAAGLPPPRTNAIQTLTRLSTSAP